MRSIVKFVEDWWVLLAAVVLGGVVAWLLAFVIVLIGAEARCLRAGWREAKVSWKFEQYCIREENEWEITRPLYEVEGRKNNGRGAEHNRE